jgi:hypothetical protein
MGNRALKPGKTNLLKFPRKGPMNILDYVTGSMLAVATEILLISGVIL